MTKDVTNSEYVEKLQENTNGNIRIVSKSGGIWIELRDITKLEIPDIPNWYVDDIEKGDDYVWVFFKYVK